MNLRNARYADDSRPIDENSSAAAGREYSRAYWRHLIISGEIFAMMALTAINLAYYQVLMAGARAAIVEGRLGDYIEKTRAEWASGEEAGA
jgi:queuine tRNA-ribosyltransferase